MSTSVAESSNRHPFDCTKNGAVSRRTLLRGAAAGMAVPALAPFGDPLARVAAAPAVRQADPGTLTIGMNGSPSDLDPHSVYDYRSAMPLRGPYESLIALDGSATDRYVPVIAESWEPNEDQSVWTFTIREGVTFHDGTPVDAEAVRASFERLATPSPLRKRIWSISEDDLPGLGWAA